MFLSRYLDQEHGPKEDAENDNFETSPLLLAAVITPIFFTILTACVCCYSPRLASAIDNLVNANNREESDRVYANTIRRQQMEEEERNMEDPIERRARLIDYFEKKLLKLVSSLSVGTNFYSYFTIYLLIRFDDQSGVCRSLQTSY